MKLAVVYCMDCAVGSDGSLVVAGFVGERGVQLHTRQQLSHGQPLRLLRG